MGKIAEEVLQHLTVLPKSKMRVTIEIDAEVPEGVAEDTQRVLTENCQTLCQRRSKSTPLAGVKMHHLMRFSPALAVVPVVHRRDPLCFV